MNDVWHSISYKGATANGLLLTEASAATSSPWFSGHFPDEPILPGVAILAMVTDAVRHHAAKTGRRIRIANIRKVRFRLPVRPDEVMTIALSFFPEEEGFSYHFRVESVGKMICTGIVTAKTLLSEHTGQEAFS